MAVRKISASYMIEDPHFQTFFTSFQTPTHENTCASLRCMTNENNICKSYV